jgi:phospholipase D-like protein/putative oligomerization/nucleic acid binding protein
VPVATSFWETFFLLLIFLPLIMVWVFALMDVFRRDDLGGGWKALWVVAIILVPFFGTLIYLISRPAGATPEERAALDEASREFVQRYSPDSSATQLQTLSDLHDRGKLTDAEFAAEKARVLGASSPAAAADEAPAAPAAPQAS